MLHTEKTSRTSFSTVVRLSVRDMSLSEPLTTPTSYLQF